MSGKGIAGVFQVTGHLLLLVEVVGNHSHGPGGFPACVHHTGGHFPIRQGMLFQAHAGGTLDGQRMHGEAFRAEFPGFLQGAGKVSLVFSRQAGDDIHVDMGNRFLPGQGVGFPYLLRGMRPADDFQRPVVHGLGIDGDPADTGLADGPELGPGEGVRPTGFHRIFHGTGETGDCFPEQLFKSVLRQGCGSTAAHIQGAQLPSAFLQDFRTGMHFPDQGGHIGTDQAAVPDFSGGEGTIGAARGAEGNADIYIHPAVAGSGQLLLFSRDLSQQRSPGRRNIEIRNQAPDGVLRR